MKTKMGILGMTAIGLFILAGSAHGQTVLIRSAAVGACSNRGLSSTSTGGFVMNSSSNIVPDIISCGINQIQAPISEIGAVVTYIKNASNTAAPSFVRLCYKSMITGTTYCGAAAYANTNVTTIQTVTAYPPSGTFNDTDYLAYFEVFLYPSTSAYNYYYGFYIRTPYVPLP